MWMTRSTPLNAGPFDAEQRWQIDMLLSSIDSERGRFCTGCRYCMPCPEGIDVPAIMGAIFDARVWGHREAARQRYHALKTPMADRCGHCGTCEDKCPQHMDIMDEMEYANMTFGPKPSV